MISTIASLVIAVIAFVVYHSMQTGNIEPGAIGQADAMTNMKIDGGFGVGIAFIILAIGIVAVIMAVIQIARSINQKRR